MAKRTTYYTARLGEDGRKIHVARVEVARSTSWIFGKDTVSPVRVLCDQGKVITPIEEIDANKFQPNAANLCEKCAAQWRKVAARQVVDLDAITIEDAWIHGWVKNERYAAGLHRSGAKALIYRNEYGCGQVTYEHHPKRRNPEYVGVQSVYTALTHAQLGPGWRWKLTDVREHTGRVLLVTQLLIRNEPYRSLQTGKMDRSALLMALEQVDAFDFGKLTIAGFRWVCASLPSQVREDNTGENWSLHNVCLEMTGHHQDVTFQMRDVTDSTRLRVESVIINWLPEHRPKVFPLYGDYTDFALCRIPD